MAGVVIIDYGAGNLGNVTRAVQRTGFRPLVTDDARALDAASALIVPGVGAAADIMHNLEGRGLAEPIRRYIDSGRPFLGVCMGMQTLLTSSDENGGQQCLGIVPGTVKRFTGPLKIPHMGWNTVRQRRHHYIFDGIPDNAYFYFVHSYYPEPADPDVVIGEAEYGRPFAAIIARDNIVATQFHPEMSSTHGLRIYENFLNHALHTTAK
jgi:imidazole glycerol-phosphate synthase subunit HisH